MIAKEFSDILPIVGRRIVGIQEKPPHEGTDDGHDLILELSGGLHLYLSGGYSAWTGKSKDEFPTHITATITTQKAKRANKTKL